MCIWSYGVGRVGVSCERNRILMQCTCFCIRTSVICCLHCIACNVVFCIHFLFKLLRNWIYQLTQEGARDRDTNILYEVYQETVLFTHKRAFDRFTSQNSKLNEKMLRDRFNSSWILLTQNSFIISDNMKTDRKTHLRYAKADFIFAKCLFYNQF